jgi:hypothetical protein
MYEPARLPDLAGFKFSKKKKKGSSKEEPLSF